MIEIRIIVKTSKIAVMVFLQKKDNFFFSFCFYRYDLYNTGTLLKSTTIFRILRIVKY